jgi:dynein heavy chain 1
MNPANPDFANRTASSPALFNRCVIDWFGDWSMEALRQVAREFTRVVDPPENSFAKRGDGPEWRSEIIVDTVVFFQKSILELNRRLMKGAKRFNYITPRDFLDFIRHFVELHAEKKG